MRPTLRATTLLAFLTAVFPRSSFAETLTDVLQTRGLTVGPQAIANLDKPITSYETFDDGTVFLIAYYLDHGSGGLKEPLFVSRFDKVSRQWRNVAILERDARSGSANCLGSVVTIHSSRHAFYLGTHLTPSAGCTLVLSHDLAVQIVLYGWFLAVFGDGTVVYHNSQIHFAPTHSAEVSIYDPRRAGSVKLYPMKPYQRIRTEHINKVRAVYSDVRWCGQRNHHCDPELFDNHVVGGVEVSDATSALAFVIAFDNKVYWSEADQWRLEGFRELRRQLGKAGLGPKLSDELFMDLYEDLARIKRLAGKDQVLELFQEDRELHDLLAAALVAQRQAGQHPRAFFGALDPRWERSNVWERLARAIEVPPEFTEVVYIYRNVNYPRQIEYKEMLLSDLKARFGDIPLRKYLEPAILRQIFQH